jgi:hypothetical protein
MGEHRQLVYYWFQQRGRNLPTSAGEVVRHWDALTRNRTDGALVLGHAGSSEPRPFRANKQLEALFAGQLC